MTDDLKLPPGSPLRSDVVHASSLATRSKRS
jgi:hypothetical protein